MVVPLLTTTSRRSPPFTWSCVSGKACISSSRPSLARRPVLARTATSLTSFPLEELSHDKSPPRTTSLRLARQVRLRLVCGPRHAARARPPTHAGMRISTSRGDNSWRPCRQPAPAGALNASLTSRATITSPSTSTLPHAKLSPRHSSTLYDTREPRLRLTCGRSSKYSGRLRQARTTRGEGQASRREQFNPATRRFPRQGITTRLRYAPTDSDVRRDVPAAKHCNSFVFPLVTLPLRL
jgi:hypothetical protein